MPLSRRRSPILIDDSEHEAAERQAQAQADFDALLVELWGPADPPERIVLVKQPRRKKGEPRNPVIGNWRDRLNS